MDRATRTPFRLAISRALKALADRLAAQPAAAGGSPAASGAAGEGAPDAPPPAESDADRFERAREAFIAAAAHEFRTPLAVIRARAQLMGKRGQGDPEAIAVIERQVDRLTHMIQNLVDASRFRLGGGELRRDPLDLAPLLEEAAAAVRLHALGPRIVVEAAPVLVLGDRRRLAQLVARLLENAVRFSPRAGTVTARVLRVGQEAHVLVRDEGPGIPLERQALVFDRPFFASAALDESSALGGALDVAREVVSQLGGRMWLESAPGRGSTFAFSLPLASPAPRPPTWEGRP